MNDEMVMVVNDRGWKKRKYMVYSTALPCSPPNYLNIAMKNRINNKQGSLNIPVIKSWSILFSSTV